MNKSEELILKYEALRQEIASLKSKRSDLIYKCSKITITEVHGFMMAAGNACLVEYWAGNSWPPSDDESSHDYSETLEEFGCDACKESFAIKRGPLAKNNQDLGIVKRQISSLGKKLIKEGVSK